LIFEQEGKTMGLDLDINPLRIENRDILTEVITRVPGIEVAQTTKTVLNDYGKKALAWKGTYVFSLLLLAVALVIFLAVSIFLGMEQH